MRRSVCKLLCAIAVAMSVGSATDTGAHQPTGVPVVAPLECTTSSDNWKLTAVKSPLGEFPIPVACEAPGHADNTCYLYSYLLERLTPPFNATADNVVVAVSADQDLDAAFPSPLSVQPPGTATGDTATGLLAYQFHEYPIRFNNVPASTLPPGPLNISVVGPSAARISTVFVRRGNFRESCLIAGPGVLGDRFQPVESVQKVQAAGGRCFADLVLDPFGNILSATIDEELSHPSCHAGQGDLFVNGEALTFLPKAGVTFGGNTSTCYPGSPKPWCICTKSPCP